MLQALGSRAPAPDARRRRVWARSLAPFGHSPPASEHIDGFFWASLPSSHPFHFSAFGLGSHTHHFHSALTYRQLEHDVRTRTRLVITIAIALESHNTSARLVYILSTPYLLCHHRCPSGLPPSTCSYRRLRPFFCYAYIWRLAPLHEPVYSISASCVFTMPKMDASISTVPVDVW